MHKILSLCYPHTFVFWSYKPIQCAGQIPWFSYNLIIEQRGTHIIRNIFPDGRQKALFIVTKHQKTELSKLGWALFCCSHCGFFKCNHRFALYKFINLSGKLQNAADDVDNNGKMVSFTKTKPIGWKIGNWLTDIDRYWQRIFSLPSENSNFEFPCCKIVIGSLCVSFMRIAKKIQSTTGMKQITHYITCHVQCTLYITSNINAYLWAQLIWTLMWYMLFCILFKNISNKLYS